MQQRREEREDVLKGYIMINGKSYPLSNWSSMGFLAQDYEGAAQLGDRIDIEVYLTSQTGSEFEFKCQAILTRVHAESKTIAGSFVRVSVDIRKKIADHFTKKTSLMAKIFSLPLFSRNQRP